MSYTALRSVPDTSHSVVGRER